MNTSKLGETELLNKLEERICRLFELGNQFDKDTFNYTIIMRFPKENKNFAGRGLEEIADCIKDVYKEAGFEVIEEKTTEGLVIPENYYKSKNIMVKRRETYQIIISQGDEYTITIV